LTKRHLRIAYVPYTDVNNAYVSRMQEVLRRFGSVEQFMRMRQFAREVLGGRFRRYDVTFFNWVENDFLKRGTGKTSASNIAKVLVKTCVARLVSRRLVFVRHNVYPHSVRPGDEDAVKKLVDWYERWFDVVISHSGAHLDRHRLYSPHPLYRLVEERLAPDRRILDLPDDYFVMFGRVAPYKRIVETARAFPAERNLLIIGSISASDAALDREIKAVDRPNVFYRPGYIDDAQAQHLIRRSKGIVLAHAGDNTVVSGSLFYAMSLPVPVLAVETPFLRWIEPLLGRELLALAPDLDGLLDRARGFATSQIFADAAPRLSQAFGDDAIAAALKPVLDGL
jgi:glycosyltransferase involved in cell wall biosynthesis